MNSIRKFIARFISLVFHPAILQGLFLFFPAGIPALSGMDIIVLVLLLIISPLIISGIYLKYAGVQDMFTIPREKRTVPFFISIAGILIAGFYFYSEIPWITERIFIIGLLNILALCITRFEKISLHIYALTLVSIVWIPEYYFLSFILLIPVIWARLELKAHSRKQIILGALAGGLAGGLILIWKINM